MDAGHWQRTAGHGLRHVVPFRLMLLALWITIAAASQNAREGALIVSAAVSMTEALEEVAAAYRTAGGGPVTFNFGGSNVLARQIVTGAPVDVFISADEMQMDVVDRAGMIASGSRHPIVTNQLVVVEDAGQPRRIQAVADLARPEVRRIAIGDPAAVPAGVYARSYLERLGLWSRLERKTVPSNNVRAALTAVQNGSADAAIVYATDVRIARGLRVAVEVAGADAPPIVYPAAVVKSTRRADAAARFLAFLRSAPALRIFQQHGFRPAAS